MTRTGDPKRRHKLEDELACPPFPKALAYLWRTFLRLSNRRGGGGFGPSPISWADIEAYARLYQQPLTAWEVEMIEALDVAYLNEQARTQQQRTADAKKDKAGKGGARGRS